MGSAGYIGRVGALAVALGIGSAIAAVPAWADTGDTDSPSSSSSPSDASSESSSASDPPSASATDSDSDAEPQPEPEPVAEAETGADEAEPVAGAEHDDEPKVSSPRKRGAARAAQAHTWRPKPTAKVAVVAADTAPAQTSLRSVAVESPSAGVAASLDTTPEAVPQMPQIAPSGLTSPSAIAEADVLDGVPVGPLATSPALWVLAAAARRQLGRDAEGVTAAASGVTTTGLMTAGTTAVPNTPPTATVTVNKPNTTTGVVTGTVKGVDADKDVLTYSSPAVSTKGGTVQVTTTNGKFTYTPTSAARRTAASSSNPADKQDSFTVTVSDGKEGTATVTVNVTIDPNRAPNPAVVTVGTPNASTGVVTGTVKTTDPDKDRLTYIAAANTAKGGKVTINASTGSFTYTPTQAARESAAGTDAADKQDLFTVTIRDAQGATVSAIVTVGISPNRAPTTPTVGSLTTNPTTGSVTGTVTSADPDGGAVRYSAASPASGKVSINATTGVFTYAPTAAARHAASRAVNPATTDSITVTATDAKGAATTRTVTVSILPSVNKIPTVSVSVGKPNITTGEVKGTVKGSDADKDKLTYSASELSTTKGTFTLNVATGAFTYKPTQAARLAAGAASAAGDPARKDVITVTITDGHTGGTITRLIEVPVTPNRAPVNPTYTAGTPNSTTGVVTGKVTATDPDKDALTYTTPASTAKGAIILNSKTGAFTYTPTQAARQAASGTDIAAKQDSFTVVITDSKGVAITQLVSVSIAPNRAPINATSSITATSTSTGAVTGTVSATDPDGDALRYTATPSASGGKVSINAGTGAFTYTPTATARHAAARLTNPVVTDSFTVTITDAKGASVSRTVTVTVLPANTTPTLTVTVGNPNSTTGVVSGTFKASDKDKDALTYTAPMSTDKGSITLSGNTFTYTPTLAARVEGRDYPPGAQDTFTVTASDGHGGTTAVIVRVRIAPPDAFTNIPVQWAAEPVEKAEADPATGIVTGRLVTVDDKSWEVRYTVVSGPDPAAGTLNLDLFDELGYWSFTPNPDARVAAYYGDPGPRTAAFTVKASDGSSETAPLTITVLITPSPASEVVRAPAGATFVGATVTGQGGTVYRAVRRQSSTDPTRYESWITGVRPDGSIVETARVTGIANGVVSGEYGVFASVTGNSGENPRVIGFTADGTAVNHLLPTGSITSIPLVVNRFGVYQLVFSHQQDTTTLVTVAGQGPATLVFNGTSNTVTNKITTGPIGVYLTTYDVAADRTRVDTIAGEGPATTVVGGWPGSTVQPGGLVAGTQGVYLTVIGQGSPHTTVVRILGQGPASTVIVGYMKGPVVMGPDGVYQTTDTRYTTGERIARIVKITADGSTTTQFNGEAIGAAIVSDYGVYQKVYDAATGKTNVVRITGTGPASVELDGDYSHSMITSPHGIYAVAYDRVDSRYVTIVTKIVGHGPSTITAPGRPVDSASTERGTYLTVTGDQTTVLTIAGEGPAMTVLSGGFPIGRLTANGAAVYQSMRNSDGLITVHTIVGDGPRSVVLPGTFESLTPTGDGTGYFVNSTTGVHFVDTTRPVPGAAGFIVDDTDAGTGTVTGRLTVPNPANQALSYAVTQAPATSVGTVTVNPTTGAFTFTPTAAARHTAWSTPFADSATFTVTATGTSVAATVTVVPAITPANQAPSSNGFTITDTDATTGVVTGKVEFTDADGDPLSYSLSTAPDAAIGTVSINSTTGAFTFTPTVAARHNAWATPGIDTATFVITATDGGAASPVAVTATIAPANQAPTPSGFTVTGADARTGIVTGKVHATDADGDTLTYTLAAPLDSRIGTVVLDSSTGVFTFTPTRTALVSAWGSATPQLVPFTVRAGDGELNATIAVTAPISASTEAVAALVARSGSLPAGVAVGPDGRVYVVNAGANSISVLDAAGALQSVTTVGLAPVDVLVAPDGRVWVVNAGDGTATVLRADGAVLQSAIVVGDSPIALASDSAGRIYVANAGAGSISVIEAGATTVARTITVGGTLTDITVSGGRVYVTDFSGSVVTVVDTANGDTLRAITEVGANPFGIVVKPDGRVYVTNPSTGTVTVLTPNGTTYVTSTLFVGGTPSSIALRTNGDVLVTDSTGSSVSIIDATTSVVSKTTVGTNPSGIAVAADGTVYVVNSGSDSLSALAPTQPVTTVDVGVDTSAVTVDPSGGSMVMVNKYDGTTTALRAGWQPPVPSHPAVVDVLALPIIGNPNSGGVTALAVSPDGTRIYTIGRDTAAGKVLIAVTDATTRTHIGTIPLNTMDAMDIAVSPDGRYVYVAAGRYHAYDDSRVIVVDTHTKTVIAEVPLGSLTIGGQQYVEHPSYNYQAHSVTVSPDGRYVYATSAEEYDYFPRSWDGLLTVIDTSTNTVIRESKLNTRNAHSVAVSPDGWQVFAAGDNGLVNGGGVLSMMAPGSYFIPQNIRLHQSDQGGATWDVAVSPDGDRVYVIGTGFDDETGLDGWLTVVNAHTHQVIKDIKVTDVSVADIDVSADGSLLLISGTHQGDNAEVQRYITVVDTYDYSVLDRIPVSAAADIAIDGRYVYVIGSQQTDIVGSSHYSFRSYLQVIDMDIVFPPVPPTPQPTNPNPPAPGRPDYGDVSPTLTYLWNTLKDRTTDGSDTNEGIYIQTVEGTSDGKHRLIVYLGGTTEDWLVNQGRLENLVVSATKSPKVEHIRAINDAITKCSNDSECGEIEEVMLIGYSQGGIDAQNLAWRGNSQMVTTVITFGSPLLEGSRSDDVTLHIQDVFDEVVNLTAVHPVFTYGAIASAKDVYVDNSGSIFQFNLFNPVATSVHGNNNTYQTISSRLDTKMAGPSTAGKLGAVEAKLNTFRGTVRDITEGEEFGED